MRVHVGFDRAETRATIPVRVTLRDSVTGRWLIGMEMDAQSYYGDHAALDPWMFEEGNYSCDCNRAIWLGYTEDRPCSVGPPTIALRLHHAETGELLYEDGPWPPETSA